MSFFCSGRRLAETSAVSISDSLLFAPPCDNDIRKKDNDTVREALFEFNVICATDTL